MCVVTHRAEPYQLALHIKKYVKPLYNTSINISISTLSMLHLQKVILIHLKNCVFYITYELPLRVSFKLSLNTFFVSCLLFIKKPYEIGNINLYVFTAETYRIKHLYLPPIL